MEDIILKLFLYLTWHFNQQLIKPLSQKKIDIIRLFSDNQYEWINFRKKRDFSLDLVSAEYMFVDENYKSSNFVGILNNKVFDNIPDLLIEGKIMNYYIHKEKFVNMPFVTEERFAYIINRLDSHDNRHGAALDTQKLCKFLETDHPGYTASR